MYTICLQNVAQNLRYWTEHYDTHILRNSQAEGRNILFVIGPFSDLFTPLANDLLDQLICSKRLTLSALQLLVFGGTITRLDLGGCSKLVNDSLIKSVARNCTRLKHLNLSNCKRLSSDAFVTLSTRLPLAVYLNFSSTSITAKALRNFLECSVNVSELVLKYCKIGDKDVKVLCSSFDQSKLSRMRSIDLSDTRVTENGLVTLLCFFSSIVHLHHHLLLDAILKVCNSDAMTAPPICLQSLSCLYVELSERDIVDLVTNFPNLSKLELKLTSMFSSLASSTFSHCDRLEELILVGDHWNGNPTKYSTSVRPLLETCGKNLLSLTLQDFREVDLLEAVSLCPKLRKLSALLNADLSSFCSGRNHVIGQCPMLSEICIWSKLGDSSLSSSTLECVLSSAVNIQKITLFQIDCFTGSVIKNILRANPLQRLKNLHLRDCNHISGKDLSVLILDEGNSLESVSLMHNWLINRSDYEGWKRAIEKMNFHVCIEWK